VGGFKTEQKVELNDDHATWLDEMASKYHLPDRNKALRCVLDHAMGDADADTIFTEFRCRHCG
jgi:hypothetical protein